MTSTPELPSAKSRRAQAQVISMPKRAPNPCSRSSLIAPFGASRRASRATWRRWLSAGPKVLSASAVPWAAPNSLAPTGLAQSTRVPSIDQSQAGNGEVACTASRGSPTPRNWKSELVIRPASSLACQHQGARLPE
ncbi:hypothetical protein ACVW0J_002557 [Bradyrhizobium sp. i1.7.7]